MISTETGGENVALVVSAGSINTTGNSNLFLGTYANGATGNVTDATAIGDGALVGQSSSLILVEREATR